LSGVFRIVIFTWNQRLISPSSVAQLPALLPHSAPPPIACECRRWMSPSTPGPESASEPAAAPSSRPPAWAPTARRTRAIAPARARGAGRNRRRGGPVAVPPCSPRSAARSRSPVPPQPFTTSPPSPPAAAPASPTHEPRLKTSLSAPAAYAAKVRSAPESTPDDVAQKPRQRADSFARPLRPGARSQGQRRTPWNHEGRS